MKRTRRIFLIIFFISIIILSQTVYWSYGGPTGEENFVSGNTESLLLWLPAITAFTSLLGAVVTTISTLSKDKRETRKSDLEDRKAELELEERRLELEKKKLDAEIEIEKKKRELEKLKNEDKQDDE